MAGGVGRGARRLYGRDLDGCAAGAGALAGAAAPDSPQGRRHAQLCVVPQRPDPQRRPFAAVVRRRHRRPARRHRREDDPQAARGADAAGRQPAAERRRARRRSPTSSRRRPTRAPRRAGAGPAHVPAAEPRRVRALDPRSARARRQRRRLPAARHQERQLRQHRRRAAAVADADAGVSDGGRRDQPAGGRRSRRRRRAKRPTRCRAGPRSGSTSRARRTARAAALSVVHTFPADGEYRFRVSFYHETTGALYGNGRAALHTAEAPEQIEISIDGERVALLDIDRWMNTSDPDGVNLRTEPIAITAGPHRVSAAFIRRLEGPAQDLISPLEWSLASTSIADAYGFTTLPHLRDLAITGPFAVDRRVARRRAAQKIFTCRPTHRAAADGRARARSSSRLGSQAFRRPVDRARSERADGALQDGRGRGRIRGRRPHGARRHPRQPALRVPLRGAPGRARAPAQAYALGDVDLASRLSFFLWATRPGRGAAARSRTRGKLSTPAVLEQQVAPHARRSPRPTCSPSRFARAVAAAAGSRQDQSRRAHLSRTSTSSSRRRCAARPSCSSSHIVREDRPVLDLFTADYTFVDERLARHYGIPNVVGNEFRKVHVSRRRAPRPARARQHPHAHVARRSHLAGAARQVGDGSAARHAAAAAAAGRADLEATAGSRRRPAAHRARAHGAAPREPGVRVVPPDDRSDRPGARELRRHRRVAHQGQRLAGRRGERALRRHAADGPGRSAAGAAQAARRRWCARSPRT